MAYDILPSTNYTHRGNLFLVTQHKIPCGITTIKHSSDLFPHSKHPKGRHTWHPPLYLKHRMLQLQFSWAIPKTCFYPTHSSQHIAKISLGQKAHDAFQIPPLQLSNFNSPAHISQKSFEIHFALLEADFLVL